MQNLSRLNFVAAMICLVGLGAGCASVSTFQSGKILPARSVQAGLGMGVGNISSKSTLPEFDAGFPDVAVEMWVRRGFLNFIDAGLKVALPGYLFTETRFRLLSEERDHPVSAALGLGWGWTFIEASRKSENETRKDSTRFVDLSPTLYISRDVMAWLTVYAAPRYLFRHTRNFRTKPGQRDAKESFNDDLLGGGIGLILFPDLEAGRLMLEYNHLQDTNESGHKQTFFGFGTDFYF